MFKRWVTTLAMAFILSLSICACNDDSGSDATKLDPVEFATRATDDYLAYDYAYPEAADGTSDADGDGEIDITDAAIIVETLKTLGFKVPETTLTGLYDGYYTEAGYDAQTEINFDKETFAYTVSHPTGEAELEAGDYTGLETGDLIFVDFDNNFIWDNAAIYLGPYEEITHAALLSYDIPDEVVIVDLDDKDSDFFNDIIDGYCDARRLNATAIEDAR